MRNRSFARRRLLEQHSGKIHGEGRGADDIGYTAIIQLDGKFIPRFTARTRTSQSLMRLRFRVWSPLADFFNKILDNGEVLVPNMRVHIKALFKWGDNF